MLPVTERAYSETSAVARAPTSSMVTRRREGARERGDGFVASAEPIVGDGEITKDQDVIGVTLQVRVENLERGIEVSRFEGARSVRLEEVFRRSGMGSAWHHEEPKCDGKHPDSAPKDLPNHPDSDSFFGQNCPCNDRR